MTSAEALAVAAAPSGSSRVRSCKGRSQIDPLAKTDLGVAKNNQSLSLSGAW